MIDITKLTKYIEENYIDPDSPEGKRERLISGKSNPLLDFARKISFSGTCKFLPSLKDMTFYSIDFHPYFLYTNYIKQSLPSIK